ncbi:hypothetical protein ACN47E_007867 [Coniothyrium glycines]
MFAFRPRADGRSDPIALCHILFLCSLWIQVSSAFRVLEIIADHGLTVRDTGGIAIIPSAPRTILIPSALPRSQTFATPSITIEKPSRYPTTLSPSLSSRSTESTTQTVFSDLEPTGIPPSSSPGSDLPVPVETNVTQISSTISNATKTPSIQSTDEGLKPIPPAATQVGDPNGHHEITEPNFTATKSCRGCSPVIELTATGWLENTAGEQHVTAGPPKATIPAGTSELVVSQDTSNGHFVIGGSTTLTLGQTVTIDDTPIVVQTSAGMTQIIMGTAVIPLQPEIAQQQTADPALTAAVPTLLPAILTLGAKIITANEQTEYVVGGQTLAPGASPITISGTTLSLAPSATAIVVNGRTSTLTPLAGGIYTTVVPAALTFKDHVYTTNRAGWIIMGTSATLIPGGHPVTIDGTTLSLDHSGTEIVVQGSTMALQPVTTIVTLTRSDFGAGSVGRWSPTGGGYVDPTTRPAVVSTASHYQHTFSMAWLEVIVTLLWWSIGYIAISS